MRKAFIYSIVLLGVVLVLQQCRPGRHGEPGNALLNTDITVISAGKSFDRVRLGARHYAALIQIDDYFLQYREPKDALWLATLSSDRSLKSVKAFNLSHSYADIASFISHCQKQPVNTVLAMAVKGSIKPPDTEDAHSGLILFENTFNGLGANARPYEDDAVSWAFICVKRPGGWVNLAEYYSRSKGITLNFIVKGDLSAYDNYPGNYIEHVAIEEKHIHLLDMLGSAIYLSDFAYNYEAPVESVHYMDAIGIPRDDLDSLGRKRRPERRIVWPDIQLGMEPSLHCRIGPGFEPGEQERETGFRVYVDGQLVSAKNERSTSTSDSEWPEWDVDLSDYENRCVDLGLHVEPGESGTFAGGCWADPFLVYKNAEMPPAPTPGRKDTESTDPYRLIFLGLAYSFNGFDKSSYGTYAGFDLTRHTNAKFAGRFEAENNSSLLKGFYSRITERRPDRFVWGGDSVYEVNSNSVSHFTTLVQSLGNLPQVLIPGNHDYLLLEDPGIRDLFSATANSTEVLGGVRFLYVNTVSSEGIPFSDGAISQPGRDWVERLVRVVSDFKRGHSIVIMMHHAPWVLEDGRANVSHAANRWWTSAVHPAIVKAAQVGNRRFYVIAGDGGTGAFAEGRMIDGIHYIVSGQPRFDDGLPNGFLELTWNEDRPGINLLIHTWRPETGFSVQEPSEYPWKF